MNTRIGLEAYRLEAAHGAFEYEREQNQPFVVSVWVTIGGDPRGKNLDASLDYGLIQQWVDHAFHQQGPAHLLEELASRIIDKASMLEKVIKVDVRIEKPEAPLPHPGGLAVVEKTWCRPDD